MYIGFNEKTNFEMMSISKEVPSLDSAFEINIKTIRNIFKLSMSVGKTYS
jgi:hypothetical protein